MVEYTQHKAKSDLFWHITNSKNIKQIKARGIQQRDGQQGKGVYCIKAKDYSALDSVVELQDQRSVKNLVVVEFEYTGEYEYTEPQNYIYANEGWAVIHSKVKPNSIKSITNIEKI